MNQADIRALTLIEVRDAIASGDLSAEAVTTAAIEQAQQFDKEYALFITFTPEAALEQARAADKARQSGAALRPLHGVPITIKDNIDTAGLRTTGGAKIFDQRVPAQDATVVTKLVAAGAISLGKTNMHEMALGGTSTNPHYGAVRNPWAPDRIPGGSSGAMAAAISLNIGYGALGTDSGGSVRMPAALCGVVGLKQTHGLVSLSGCMPTGTWSTDHIGPATKTVADSGLLLSLMQGHDPNDPDSARRLPEPFGPIESLAGITVGVPEAYFWEELDSDVEASCRQALDLMRDAGASIVPIALETLDLLQVARPSLMAEAFVFHEPYLRAHLEDYGADIRYRLLAGQYVSAADYIRAQRVRRLFTEEFSRALAGVDLLVMPTVPITAPLIATDAPISDPNATWVLARNTFPANQSGVPAISIPSGLSRDGLPIGLQLVAGAFQDQKLLAIAGLVEQLIGFAITPSALKQLEVAV